MGWASATFGGMEVSIQSADPPHNTQNLEIGFGKLGLGKQDLFYQAPDLRFRKTFHPEYDAEAMGSQSGSRADFYFEKSGTNRPLGPKVHIGRSRALLECLGLVAIVWHAVCSRQPRWSGDPSGERPLVMKGRPTQKTTHPNKNSLHKQFAQTISGQFVQIVPSFPFKISRKQTKEFAQTVCANCFYLVGWFFGWVAFPSIGTPQIFPQILCRSLRDSGTPIFKTPKRRRKICGKSAQKLRMCTVQQIQNLLKNLRTKDCAKISAKKCAKICAPKSA